jgi:hypothetical protein
VKPSDVLKVKLNGSGGIALWIYSEQDKANVKDAAGNKK